MVGAAEVLAAEELAAVRARRPAAARHLEPIPPPAPGELHRQTPRHRAERLHRQPTAHFKPRAMLEQRDFTAEQQVTTT